MPSFIWFLIALVAYLLIGFGAAVAVMLVWLGFRLFPMLFFGALMYALHRRF